MQKEKYSLYNYDPGVIRTRSGIWFNPFEPTPEMINIEDIAHSLAYQCRFGGHTSKFYSVAQHSIATSMIVKRKHRLAALLHDASEAYLIDVPRPIKQKLINYKEIETRVMEAIAEKYGFDLPLHAEIKFADEAALQQEWDSLIVCNKSTLDCWSPAKAKRNFIHRFNLLYDKAAIL